MCYSVAHYWSREGAIRITRTRPATTKARSERAEATGNGGLNRAGCAKRDEFYTTYEDIEAEMRHYPQCFRGKSVLCNCDDSCESNFFHYFVRNFNRLGLKRLVCTSYAESGLSGESRGRFGCDAYKVVGTSVRNDGVMEDLDELFNMSGNELARLEATVIPGRPSASPS